MILVGDKLRPSHLALLEATFVWIEAVSHFVRENVLKKLILKKKSADDQYIMKN